MSEQPIIRIEVDGFAADAFEVVSFRGSEALSTLFRFTVTLSSATPTQDFDALLEAKAHLILGEPAMHIRGVLTSVQQSYQGSWQTEAGTRTRFDVVLMPEVSVLALTSRSRVYQEKNSVDVVKDILKEAGIPGDGIEWRLSGEPEKKEFILQYQESDLDFMQRLMEHDGIHYHFEHGDDVDKIVFGNSNAAFQPISGEADVRLGIPDPSLGIPGVGPWGYEQTNTRFQSRQRVVPKKVILNDYNYRTASLDLMVEGEIKDTRAAMGTQYYFADNYLKPPEGNALRDLRKEEILAGKRTYSGAGTVRRYYPGGKFKLVGLGDVDAGLEQEYVLTEVSSGGSQPLAHAPGSQGYEYSNTFTCIPESIVFRPERRAAWPQIAGLVHAKICAPKGGGKYAHVDDKGRYKIQFLFDLEGKGDDKSSCFVRLSESYVGADFGIHQPLLKDFEVVVAFEYGDPDRPVIVGALYNNDFPSPVKDSNHAQSVWRSAGKNEIRFDDTEESEHVFLHGQKDWNIVIENNKSQSIGKDETHNVGQDLTLDVKRDTKTIYGRDVTTSTTRDQKHDVTGKRNVSITGTDDLKVTGAMTIVGEGGMGTTVSGGDHTTKVTGNHSATVSGVWSAKADGDAGIKSGATITLDGASTIVLKVGGSSITIDSSSITLKAPDIKIEGSGSVSMKAPAIKSTADGKNEVLGAMVDVKGSGPVNVKGAIVQVN